ncbi:hypothetical protein F9C11_37905 [Amycolatopsis sp. VS8301801F10]
MADGSVGAGVVSVDRGRSVGAGVIRWIADGSVGAVRVVGLRLRVGR